MAMTGEAAEGRVWDLGTVWEGVRCRQVTIRIRIGFNVGVTLGHFSVELLQDSRKQHCSELSRVEMG